MAAQLRPLRRRRFPLGPVHAAGLLLLGPFRQEHHSGQGVPDRCGHRGRPGPAGRRPEPRSASSSTTARKAAAAACIRSVSPTARALYSAIPTATLGTCRRSGSVTPSASNLARLPSAPQATWRARFGVRRPPTASTRSAAGSATRTGQTGTLPTWWRSSLAKSCRNERLRQIGFELVLHWPIETTRITGHLGCRTINVGSYCAEGSPNIGPNLASSISRPRIAHASFTERTTCKLGRVASPSTSKIRAIPNV
jgi:hypothetical protein